MFAFVSKEIIFIVLIYLFPISITSSFSSSITFGLDISISGKKGK